MKSIIIESSDVSTLNKIVDFIKYFWPGIKIQEKSLKKESGIAKGQFKSSKEFRQAIGIWADRTIEQNDLRQKSWRSKQ